MQLISIILIFLYNIIFFLYCLLSFITYHVSFHVNFFVFLYFKLDNKNQITCGSLSI